MMAGENENKAREDLGAVEKLTDDYCMRCPEDTLNNPDICESCHVRKMVDYYRGAAEPQTPNNSGNGKTREDVENLKRSWKSDPCWDIYEAGDGFEEYRDELMAFQKECEADWERKRQEERNKLAELICPLVTHTDCKCYLEKCAWWCDWKDCCSLKAMAIRLDDIAENLPGAGRGF